jgi:hypothetical protein
MTGFNGLEHRRARRINFGDCTYLVWLFYFFNFVATSVLNMYLFIWVVMCHLLTGVCWCRIWVSISCMTHNRVTHGLYRRTRV